MEKPFHDEMRRAANEVRGYSDQQLIFWLTTGDVYVSAGPYRAFLLEAAMRLAQRNRSLRRVRIGSWVLTGILVIWLLLDLLIFYNHYT